MRKLWILWVLVAGLASGARAQAPAEKVPDKPSIFPMTTPVETVVVDKKSPRQFLEEFMSLAHAEDWEKAARYMQFTGSRLSQDDKERAAADFYMVLDRSIGLRPKLLSSNEEGDTKDGLPADVDSLGIIKVGSKTYPVEIVKRFSQEPPFWRFSPTIVRDIPELYDRFGEAKIQRYLPDVFVRVEFLNVALWQWIGLVILGVVCFFGSLLIAYLLKIVLLRVTKKSTKHFDEKAVDELTQPLRLMVALLIGAAGFASLRFSAEARDFFLVIGKTAFVFSLTWTLFRIINAVSLVAGTRLLQSGKVSVYSILPLGRKTAKVVIGILALVAMMQNFGINVSALIAGLGVGGIAVALAGQKTIENFFGGLTVSVDQPVRVGDFCKFGSRQGTVEDVGLRSVKIRTPDRTIVTVANGEFSQMQIENVTKRDKIRFATTLGLRMDTSPNQLRAVLIELRKLLMSYAKVDTSDCSVRLVNFGPSTFDIEIATYILTTDAGLYAAVREDLLLRILDVLATQGTAMAFPTTTTYIAREKGPDEALRAKVEAGVAAEVAKGDLWLPQIPDEEIAKMRGSIGYPPVGSALLKQTDKEAELSG